MKKIISYFIVICLTSFAVFPQKAQAEMPAKAKAFLTIAGYGTVAGALLGVASMAFGQNGRNIPRGASLGLYAGIIFGTYVLVSHHQKQQGYYDDSDSVYQSSRDIYGDQYNSNDGGSEDSGFRKRGFFDRFEVMQDPQYHQNFTFQSQKTKTVIPPIHVNVLNLSF